MRESPADAVLDWPITTPAKSERTRTERLAAAKQNEVGQIEIDRAGTTLTSS